MPYAIKDINTNNFFDDRPINSTRLFSSKGAAHSCRDYNPASHHLVEVEVVEISGKDPIRQGQWLTEQEFIARYGACHWQPQDVLTVPHCPWIYRARAYPHDPNDAIFQVKGKEVYQTIYYTAEDPRRPYGHPERDVPQPKMVLVYPSRPQHFHMY